MRQIIGAFGILFIMMANIFICTGLIGASGQVAAAKEYKSQVVAELENSNFNPGVIDACKKKAAEDGYELEISDCVYDAWQNMRAAQVALKYHYRIPVLEFTKRILHMRLRGDRFEPYDDRGKIWRSVSGDFGWQCSDKNVL